MVTRFLVLYPAGDSLLRAQVHPCAKRTHKIAAAAAAAAVAAKISARRRHGKKKSRFLRKFGKRKNCKKTSKKSMNIDKNINFGGARKKWTSPSNSTRKTTYIDLPDLRHEETFQSARSRQHRSRIVDKQIVFFLLIVSTG